MPRTGTGNWPARSPHRPRNDIKDESSRRAQPDLPPNNLPTPLTSLIGRQAEVEAVRSLILDESVRLLTLTGPGGMGKTRLALQAARVLLPSFEDGAYFVALASLSDPQFVLPTIAQALGIKEEGATPLSDRLSEHLRDKGLLLVLDNFEQIASAAPQVSTLLRDAPGAQVITTSRVSLRLYGEHLYPVPPLEVPATDDTISIVHRPSSIVRLGNYPSVELFVERARSARPDFTLTDANAEDIAQICRRLDGLPLAIELAAARTRLFSPQALLARLSKSLPLLTGGALDLPDRQHTLRNTIAWSYNLLEPTEQELFARLSVFADGCTLDAAAHVAGGLGLEEGELLDALTSLIDKNLLRQRDQPDGEPRFWMLATIREYALEKLSESSLAEVVQQAHAEFFLELAEKASLSLRTSQQKHWFEVLERDHANFRESLAFLLPQRDPDRGARLATALNWFWYVQGYYTESRKWLDLAVSALDSGPQLKGGEPSEVVLTSRAEILRAAGLLAYVQSDYSQAVALTRRSLEIARKLGDKYIVARALNNLGTILEQQGDLKQALPFFEESLAVRRELGDRATIGFALNNLALIVERQGDYERAHTLNAESIATARDLGDSTNLASYTYNAGRIAYRQGDFEHAAVALYESLTLAREIGFKLCELWALSEIGMVLCDQGDAEGASAILDEALQLARQSGDLTEISWILLGQAKVTLLRQDFERARALLQESLRLRVQVREYNLSTLDTLEWLASVEAHAAVRSSKAKGARRAAMLFGACEARREEMKSPISRVWRKAHKQAVEQARSLLGRQTFAAVWAEGRAISFEEAVALGLQELAGDGEGLCAQPQPAKAAPESDLELTSRELEVLRFVAQGLTNKEIGERLVLSHRTVQAHLYTIFSKLDVTTRSAATRAAIEHGLV